MSWASPLLLFSSGALNFFIPYLALVGNNLYKKYSELLSHCSSIFHFPMYLLRLYNANLIVEIVDIPVNILWQFQSGGHPCVQYLGWRTFMLGTGVRVYMYSLSFFFDDFLYSCTISSFWHSYILMLDNTVGSFHLIYFLLFIAFSFCLFS